MKTFVRTAILAVAVAATTLSPMVEANAGEPWRRPAPRDRASLDHDRRGDMLAAGILGLAVGALVVGAANSQPRYAEPIEPDPYREPRRAMDQGYFPDPPPPRTYRGEPNVITYDGYRDGRYRSGDYDRDAYAAPEPWTREWYRFCEQRYRTFDPRTGTYTASGGVKRFCVAG